MKKYAVVTALTLSTYQTFGYEVGHILTVMDSYEYKGQKWFRFMGSNNLVQRCREEFFDMKTVTESDLAAKRLETTLRDLLHRIWESDPDARRQIEESIQGAPTHHEEHAEMMAQHLVEFIENNCDDALLKLADYAQPFEEAEV